MNNLIKFLGVALLARIGFFVTKAYASVSLMPTQIYSTPEQEYHKDGYTTFTPNGSEIHYRIKELSSHRETQNGGEPNVLVVFHPNKAYVHDYYNTLLDFNHLAKITDYSHIVFWDYPNSGFSKSQYWLATKDLLVQDGFYLVNEVANKLTDGDYSKISFYGWSLGGGIAAEVALELQNQFGDEGVISKITLDRTFTSVSDYIQKSYYVPKTIADYFAWAVGVDFNTEEAFNALKTETKNVYYIPYDERIGDAIFKDGDTGEFFEVVELVDHGDSSHLNSHGVIEF